MDSWVIVVRCSKSRLLRFTTNIKPVPQNRKLARGKGARLYLNKEYSTTWQAIGYQFNTQMVGPPLTGDVSLEIEFGWSRMDLDSCLKSILDTLQGIAYVNDKQVVRIALSRIDTPEIIIKIS